KPETLGADLVRWLNADGSLPAPDIVVLGLQEVVDLESKTLTARSLWQTTTAKNKIRGADISKRYGRWRSALESALARGAAFAEPFRVIETQSLVGLFICVLARDDVVRRVRAVDVAHVKTGMGGLHGNKGAVAVRLVVDDSALCFVNAHLAAGESPRNNAARVAHCASIVQGLAFSRPVPEIVSATGAQGLPPELANVALDAMVDGGDGTRFFDHAICFFSGDLNFRLRMARALAERCIESGDLDPLLRNDQLLPLIAGENTSLAVPAVQEQPQTETLYSAFYASDSDPEPDAEVPAQASATASGSTGFVLRAFREMPITFRPTYKYDVGTDRYDSSEKRRTPAWCDRVLFRPRGFRDIQQPAHPFQGEGDLQGQINPQIYRRQEDCRLSDHRPISATFAVKIKLIDREARARARARVAAEICAQYESSDAVELARMAKLLWISRHTDSMAKAVEFLDRSNGDLQLAIHNLYR
ncbi:hypothetical protein FB639_002873, partial [Coemansia asiatica]